MMSSSGRPGMPQSSGIRMAGSSPHSRDLRKRLAEQAAKPKQHQPKVYVRLVGVAYITAELFCLGRKGNQETRFCHKM